MILLDSLAEAARALSNFSNVNLVLLTFNPGSQATGSFPLLNLVETRGFPVTVMDDGFGRVGLASNLNLNAFGGWNKVPFGAENGTIFPATAMDNGFGRIGFASNLNLNAFGGWNKVPFGAENGTMDITLRLDSPGTSILCGSSSTGTKRKWGDIYGPDGSADAFLALGLGRPSSSSDNGKVSSATVCTISSAKETTDEESSMDLSLNFQLHLGNEDTLAPKKHSAATPKALKTGLVCDLQLSLSTMPSESIVTDITPVSARQQYSQETSLTASPVPITDDEVSTPAGWKFGSYTLPSLNNTGVSRGFTLQQNTPPKADPVPFTPDLPSTMTETLKSPVACTSGVTHSQPRNTSTKACQFQGCVKGARGASGLCIAHGGGRRCQKAGCHKGAEGRTVYCKTHGGGRRCQFLGCTKSAEGRTDYCIAHGGGRRCSYEGCIRAARGKSGLCIRHGGGKRCQMENCSKSAEGYSGLCISHGGGRRCQFPQCTKGAQGSTMFCKAHGGGKRCTALGCTKGAEGSTSFCKGHGGGKRCSFQGVCPKSVHGGTQFCVAHGGGKRCAVPECTKSARGRTDYCVGHGGGKRCKFEGCGKSAQGSTDFCKAHGGGKRCSWGHGELTDLGAGGPPCDRFARGKTGLCAAHSALVQDRCIHGGGTLGPADATQLSVMVKPEKLKEVYVQGDIFSKTVTDRSNVAWSSPDPEKFMHPMVAPLQTKPVAIPEGRVHGGGAVMAFLSSNPAVGSQSTSFPEAGTSKQGPSYGGMHHWM